MFLRPCLRLPVRLLVPGDENKGMQVCSFDSDLKFIEKQHVRASDFQRRNELLLK